MWKYFSACLPIDHQLEDIKKPVIVSYISAQLLSAYVFFVHPHAFLGHATYHSTPLSPAWKHIASFLTLASNRLKNLHEVLLRGSQDVASFMLLYGLLSRDLWLWEVVKILQGTVKQLVQLRILGSHLEHVVSRSGRNLINLSLSPKAASRQVGRALLSWVPALPRHFCYVGPCRPPCTHNYIRPG